jgi:outer membrane protein TolC
VSETRWDSDLARNVIQRENSRRVEAELSIRQPVILFGYPTNGYLSLTSRLYRLTQSDDDSADIRYYNRYFVSYTQPLFQANELKNELEEAELDFESQELDFYNNMVEIIDNTSEDYFELFEIGHQQEIRSGYVATLQQALGLAEAAAEADPSRSIDIDQIRVELGNAREDLTSSESRYRLETSSLKTEFGIPQETEIVVDASIELARVTVDVEQATRYALELTPRMRQLDIQHRERELDVDNTKGRGGFELDLSVSYGREMQDDVFGDIWGKPENSYTVDVEGSIPLWDWGQRDKRIQAEELGLEQSRLRIEETTADITADILNEVRNVEEYEDRAFNMQANLGLSSEISQRSLSQYEQGEISALDLLQSLRREVDTAENFLDVYLGWRQALQRLQEITYYDWERDALLLDRFGISFADYVGGL